MSIRIGARARSAALTAVSCGTSAAVSAVFALLILVGVPVAAQIHSASAATIRTLHAFCSEANCADGQGPTGGLVQDQAGNLFGTTNNGGNSHNAGVVFELKNAGGGHWKFRTLYQFCSEQNCSDGTHPTSLIMDTSGNLYGTTFSGGNNENGGGVVFKLVPNARGTKWKLKVLHDFCVLQNCTDGLWAFSKLTYVGAATGALYDGVSPLYGTTQSGGQYLYFGTVFQLVPHKGQWKHSVLYSFCPEGGTCPDGASPAGVIVDVAGNLIGVASGMGLPSNGGTVFQLSPKKHHSWSETTLYSFCPQAGCHDGTSPGGSLTFDASGNLLGVAGGGTGANCPEGDVSGCGVVFKIKPKGENSAETVLYDFCSLSDCADGAFPGPGPLTITSDGTIIGTTQGGGGNDIDRYGYGGGTVTELSGSNENVLYAFCSRTNCRDGSYPQTGVILDGSGNLFGTTTSGGTAESAGTVFEIEP